MGLHPVYPHAEAVTSVPERLWDADRQEVK
jgi:hypothetical protein